MRTKNIVALIVVFLLSLYLLSVNGFAREEKGKEVIALGVADGKSSRARDEAINDALRKAVEQGVGTYVTAELTVEQKRLVEERIYTESSGYIGGYEILREGEEAGLYEVEVSALVKMGKLADDLRSIGLLIRKKQNPRVMVIITSGEMDSSFTGVALEGNRNAENQLERALMEKGLQLVDAGQVRRKKELEAFLLEGDPAGAGKIAKDFGAEILIQGEARRSFVNKRQIFGRPTRFFSNEIRLKAIETDTGKILFSGYRTRPPSGAGALLPLEESTTDLAEEMIEGILKQWRQDVFQAATYELSITGASFNGLSGFKEGLKKIRGLHGVQTRSFRSGQALLEVKYQGPLEELAEKIDGMEGLSPEIIGMQSNSLEISLEPG